MVFFAVENKGNYEQDHYYPQRGLELPEEKRTGDAGGRDGPISKSNIKESSTRSAGPITAKVR